MNILVFSGEISPYKGSEAAVGWNYVSQMSTCHHLFVLYGGYENKENITSYLESNSLSNVDFFYAGDHQQDIDWTRHPIYGYYLAIKKYHEWQYKVLELARKIVNDNKIDIIHYLNPIGFKEPGFLYELNLPYVWGPVQGVEDYPLVLYPTLHLRGFLEGISRMIFLNWKLYMSNHLKQAVKHCDVILSATPRTKIELKKVFHQDSVYLPENAILSMEASVPISYKANTKLNIISVGQLSDRKGFILQLKTVKKLVQDGYKNFSWKIFGQGYAYPYLQKFICKYHLSQYVQLMGQVSRDTVQKYFNQSQLNIISSLSEATTTVLWEAMAKGIPTMTLDHCGMGGVLSSNNSFLVPIENVHSIVNKFATNIENIFSNPDIIKIKSAATLDAAVNNTWSKRIKKFENIYNNAIKNHI